MVDIANFELMKMVQFFYNMDYDDEVKGIEGKDISRLQVHVRMFAIGDKFDIPVLRSLAAEKYGNRCSLSWNDLEFLGSIREIYTSTPDSIPELRNVAVSVALCKVQDMQKSKDVKEVYEGLLKEVPEFARHLLSEYVNYGECDSSRKKRMRIRA